MLHTFHMSHIIQPRKEMRLELTDQENEAALRVAVACGHGSKRRAVMDVFREHHERHIAEIQKKMRNSSRNAPALIKKATSKP